MLKRFRIFTTILLIYSLLSCNDEQQKLIVTSSPCPNAPTIYVNNFQATSANVSFQANPSVNEYKVVVKNIENATTTTHSIFPQGNLSVTYALTGLMEGTTYSVYVQPHCQNPNPNFPYPFPMNKSNTEYFSTNVTNGCGGASNFDLYTVKRDTLAFSFRMPFNSIANAKLYVVNGLGDVANVYTIPIFAVAGSLTYHQVKTNLPKGDYTAWIETVCSNGNSYPSNIGVFTVTTGGGGPIVVLDDEIDIYRNPSFPTSLITIPKYHTTSDCIPARSETFTEIPVPKQIMVGYSIPFNMSNQCAPINSTKSRIKSYRVYAPQMNGLNGKYRVSLPPIKCVCANEYYQIKVLANEEYQQLPTGFVQNCAGCN